MMSLKIVPYLHRPISPMATLPIRPLSLISASSFTIAHGFSSAHGFASATISAPAATATTIAAAIVNTIEHVTLFKVRPNRDPSFMLSKLLSLSSLNLTSHIFVTLLFRSHLPDGFTHLLHVRFPSKSSFDAFSAHPSYIQVVESEILPICDDIVDVDWVSNVPSGPPPGYGARLALIKLKAGVAAREVVGVLDGVEGKMPEGVVQVSYGENFSPAKAKGYGVGLLCVLEGLEKVFVVDRAREVEALKEKVRPLLESVIVVDYMIPIILMG